MDKLHEENHARDKTRHQPHTGNPGTASSSSSSSASSSSVGSIVGERGRSEMCGTSSSASSSAAALRTTIPTRPKKESSKDKKKKKPKLDSAMVALLNHKTSHSTIAGSSTSSTSSSSSSNGSTGSLLIPLTKSLCSSTTGAGDTSPRKKSTTPPPVVKAATVAVAGGSALPIPNFHKRTASISTLPEELVVKILSYLPHFPGLTRCSTVNKKWHRLSTSEELWRQVYLGEYEKIASDRLVVWIAALNPGLEVLSLKGCTQVSDVGLTAALGRCSNLRELHLEDLERQFSSRALLMIGKLCPSLHTLVLPGILEHPDEVIEPIITYLPQLRVFKSFSQFTDSTFKCLAERCKSLQKLRFGTTTKSTILTQPAVRYLTACENLQSLECGYFSLGERDWGKKPLANFRALRAFGWFDMTSDALWAFLKNTPALEVLHLIHSGAELGEGMLMDSFRLQSIGQYCPSIRDINLCDTSFCENDVQVLVKECKNLRELRVGMKSNPGTRYEITDSWVYQVINFSTKIEVLKIYHADIRTDTVSMLTRGCKKLRSLTLGRCSPVTVLSSHLETLPTLQKLSLRNTPTNDSALQMLMSAFPNLQTLTLIETGVSDALIGYIIGRYRLNSIKLQPRARLTSTGKILYKGGRRGRFAKKKTLTDQERLFLNLFQTQTRTETIIRKEGPSWEAGSGIYSPGRGKNES